ncbi:MAG: efflux transporter outer membrane subunit [Desulfobacterales bacterium]|nr:efflux transporter outer membrane subunit [Desulfobacterales bacterium]
MRQIVKYTIFSVIIGAALTGCFKIGPDYVRPDQGFQIPGNYENGQEKASVIVVPDDRWWQAFGDPEIDRLVETVFLNNPDIRKASAQVLEVRSYFRQTRADRFPSIAAQGQFQKVHQSVTNPMTQISESQTTDIYTLSLPVSFELDLWGRISRAGEAARADLLMAEENKRTMAQSLAAEAISLYLQMESLERRIEITKRSIKTYQRSLDFVESRYQRGLTSILDVRQARRRLAQAESGLPSLIQDLGTTQQRLFILKGAYPKTEEPRIHEEDYFKRLVPVPPGLPAELLNRRPDIRAAEARLKGLNARVGVAKAYRFPQITLTGGYGYTSSELDNLFEPEAELWSLASGLTMPLFNAGKLKAGQRAAEARYAQGLTDYAKTVLSAFAEVEGALLTRKQQLERRELVINFLQEARATQDLAQERYERGLTDYLTVLEAQQTRFGAEENLVLVDFVILSNRVRLHRALGGGWETDD